MVRHGVKRIKLSPKGTAAILALSLVSPLAAAQQGPDGAQGSATALDALTATAPMAGVPQVGEGAPMLTVQEVHQKGVDARGGREDFENRRHTVTQCYMTTFGVAPTLDRMLGYDEGAEAARRISNWSRLGETATAALEIARVDAAAGRISRADLEKAELERQHAVIEMTKAELDYEEAKQMAIDLQQLIKQHADPGSWRSEVMTRSAERARRTNEVTAAEFKDLGLTGIQAVERRDDKGAPYLYITGSIHNARTTGISIPPLAITAVDLKGYPLMTEQAKVSGRIEPGGSQAFAYALRPSPDRTARVTVTFAGLAGPRALEPVEVDPVCQYHPITPYYQRGARVRSCDGSEVPFTPDEIAWLDPRALGGGAHAAASGRVSLSGSKNVETSAIVGAGQPCPSTREPGPTPSRTR